MKQWCIVVVWNNDNFIFVIIIILEGFNFQISLTRKEEQTKDIKFWFKYSQHPHSI